MALNPKLSVASCNLALNAALDVLNSGFLDIYDSTGTGQPASPDTAVTTQVKLARLNLGATAFAAASGGSKVGNAISATTGITGGTATWYRLVTSGGSAVADGSVGTATSNLVLNATAIVTGAAVTVTAMTHSMAQ
jgi:hypothetical protein